MDTYEHCCVCDRLTDKAGRGDDSLYTDDGKGPFCDTCFSSARIIDSEQLTAGQLQQIEKLEAEVEKAYREGWWDSRNHRNPDVGAAFGVPTNDDLGWIKYLAKMKEED